MNILQTIFGKRTPNDQDVNVTRCESCRRMKVKGRDLIFISWVHRNGSGTSDVSTNDMTYLDDDTFDLNSLSITNKTYIACEFNSYVVRLRNQK